jgi:lipid-A-disaccharide synthase
MKKRIAIVAGEKSGDILGARLIQALNAQHPNLCFEGIGGEEMLAEGLESFFPMERLSVMGFTEVIRRLPELLMIRYKLIQRWLKSPPDLFIGIDAPDFNLKLEARLHQANIKTVHYVSPSIWAWRQKRVHKIKGHLDLMLTLFPFEAAFYEKHGVPVAFTGHPLADEVPLESNQQAARQQLQIAPNSQVLAVLPGSRGSELKYLAEPFINALQQLQYKYPDLVLVSPMVSDKLFQCFQQQCLDYAPALKITLIKGQSRVVMTAADYILVASGTAVLEGMFVGRPMVAAGKLSAITVKIIRLFGMLNTIYYTLPNNLANEELVTELIQEDVTVDKLVTSIEHLFLLSDERKRYLLTRFTVLHKALRQDASKTAANILTQKFL